MSKGAMNTHKNFVYSIRNIQQWFRITEKDRMLGKIKKNLCKYATFNLMIYWETAIAPVFHMLGLLSNIGVVFGTGCSAVFPYRFNPTLAAHLVEKYKCTSVFAAVTAYGAILNEKNAGLFKLDSITKACSAGGDLIYPFFFSVLTFFFLGKAPIAVSVVNAFFSKFNVRIHPGYGMTGYF